MDRTKRALKGQTIVEYALILMAVLAIGCGASQAFGNIVRARTQTVVETLGGANIGQVTLHRGCRRPCGGRRR